MHSVVCIAQHRALFIAGVPVPSIAEAEPVPVPQRSADRADASGQCSMKRCVAALLGRMRDNAPNISTDAACNGSVGKSKLTSKAVLQLFAQ